MKCIGSWERTLQCGKVWWDSIEWNFDFSPMKTELILTVLNVKSRRRWINIPCVGEKCYFDVKKKRKRKKAVEVSQCDEQNKKMKKIPFHMLKLFFTTSIEIHRTLFQRYNTHFSDRIVILWYFSIWNNVFISWNSDQICDFIIFIDLFIMDSNHWNTLSK